MQSTQILRQIDHCLKMGDTREAENIANRYLAEQDNGAMRLALARLIRRQSRFAEARAVLAPVIEGQACPTEALIEMARILDGLDEHEGALLLADKAVTADATNPYAWQEVGLACVALKKLPRAMDAFSNMVHKLPQSANAWSSLGNVHLELGNVALAEGALRKAVSIAPANADVKLNLGNVLVMQGKTGEAQKQFHEVLAISPQSDKALMALASVAEKERRFEEMLSFMKRLLALKTTPGVLDFFMAAVAAAGVGDDVGALGYIAQGKSLYPDSLRLNLADFLYLPMFYKSADDVKTYRQRFVDGLNLIQKNYTEINLENAQEALTHNIFLLAYQGQNDYILQSQYGNWLNNLMDNAYPELKVVNAPSVNRTRPSIGIISTNFNHGTIGKYFGEWPTALESRGFEVTVYHLRREIDELASKLRDQATHFIHVPTLGLHFKDTVAQIQAACHDIVLFTDVGMDGPAFGLAAIRLAPLQVAAWGHPVTTGLPSVDIFLSCAAMEPSNAQDNYRERLALLPGLGTYYEAAQLQEGVTFWPFAEDEIVFVCSQSFFKIHPDCDTLFARVLTAVPESKLVLFAGESAAVHNQFKARLAKVLPNSEMARLVFLNRMSHPDFLRFSACCTLALDTLHFCGGNTSLDAFAVGLPVVTLPGEFMRGRQTAAMLEILDLPELIAKDEDDYVRIARQVAYDPEFLGRIKKSLGENQSNLFNDTSPLDRLAEILHSELNRAC